MSDTTKFFKELDAAEEITAISISMNVNVRSEILERDCTIVRLMEDNKKLREKSEFYVEGTRLLSSEIREWKNRVTLLRDQLMKLSFELASITQDQNSQKYMLDNISGQLSACVANIASVTAERDAYRAALEPFGRPENGWLTDLPDDTVVVVMSGGTTIFLTLTLKDLRNARAALAKAGKE
jgi:chromosome segregation ATPase